MAEGIVDHVEAFQLQQARYFQGAKNSMDVGAKEIRFAGQKKAEFPVSWDLISQWKTDGHSVTYENDGDVLVVTFKA